MTRWRKAALRALFIDLGLSEQAAEEKSKQGFAHFLSVRSDFQVPEASLSVLSQLAARLPVIAITNGNVDLTKIGLEQAFSLVFKAGNGLRAKPHQDMFVSAANQLQLEIHDLLHVGDHLHTDIFGARQNGAQAVWFNDQGDCLKQHKDSALLPDIEISKLEQLLLLI